MIARNSTESGRKRIKGLPSIIDQLPSYDISEDILNIQSTIKLGQLLKYPEQKRNIAKILRRPRPRETNLVDQPSKWIDQRDTMAQNVK